MNLIEKVNKELILAMKAKDDVAKRSIRAIKSAILITNTDGSGKELDAAGEIKLLQKLVKQRQDSLEIYIKQDREDLAKVEKEEIEVIQKFLPEQISEDKLVSIITGIVTKTGASGMKDMGKVMGMASGQLAGKADGKMIAKVVKGLLG